MFFCFTEYFIAKIIPGQTTTTDQDDSGGDTKALPEYKVRGYAERGMYFSLVDGNAGVALDLLNRFFNPGCPTRALLLKAMGETELLLSDYRETNSPLDYAYLRAGFEPK